MHGSKALKPFQMAMDLLDYDKNEVYVKCLSNFLDI